jgi:hypothetical protein
MLKSEFVIGLAIFIMLFLVWVGVKACKSLNYFYDNVLTPHCHMCGCETEIEFVCERCDEFCCYDCSVKMTYMNQIDFHCCGNCEDSRFD